MRIFIATSLVFAGATVVSSLAIPSIHDLCVSPPSTVPEIGLRVLISDSSSPSHDQKLMHGRAHQIHPRNAGISRSVTGLPNNAKLVVKRESEWDTDFALWVRSNPEESFRSISEGSNLSETAHLIQKPDLKAEKRAEAAKRKEDKREAKEAEKARRKADKASKERYDERQKSKEKWQKANRKHVQVTFQEQHGGGSSSGMANVLPSGVLPKK